MSNFSILMCIFSILVFLAGLYLYTGHKTDFTELLLWKSHNVKKMPIDDIKKAGKWTIIASLIIALIGVLGIILKFE